MEIRDVVRGKLENGLGHFFLFTQGFSWKELYVRESAVLGFSLKTRKEKPGNNPSSATPKQKSTLGNSLAMLKIFRNNVHFRARIATGLGFALCHGLKVPFHGFDKLRITRPLEGFDNKDAVLAQVLPTFSP